MDETKTRVSESVDDPSSVDGQLSETSVNSRSGSPPGPVPVRFESKAGRFESKAGRFGSRAAESESWAVDVRAVPERPEPKPRSPQANTTDSSMDARQSDKPARAPAGDTAPGANSPGCATESGLQPPEERARMPTSASIPRWGHGIYEVEFGEKPSSRPNRRAAMPGSGGAAKTCPKMAWTPSVAAEDAPEELTRVRLRPSWDHAGPRGRARLRHREQLRRGLIRLAACSIGFGLISVLVGMIEPSNNEVTVLRWLRSVIGHPWRSLLAIQLILAGSARWSWGVEDEGVNDSGYSAQLHSKRRS